MLHTISLPGVTATGTTSPRTLEDRFADVVNFKDVGVKGDGVTDDTVAIQSAFSRLISKNGVIPPGTYKVTDTLTLSASDVEINAFGAIFSVPNGWANKSVIDITGARTRLLGLSVIETGASAINTAKSGANNVGINILASGVRLESCATDGFGFGIRVSGILADRDHVTLVDCTVSRAYSWGLEIESSTSCTLINPKAHTCGLDGIKILNQYGRTADRLLIVGGDAYNNGQRDTAAGGIETTNGNGIDLYNGGWRFTISGLHCRDNYGSGFNMKGIASSEPRQGEASFIGCHAHGNKNTTGTVGSHGFEFNTSGGNDAIMISLVGCHASDNTGYGLVQLGGHAFSLLGGSMVENALGGVKVMGYDMVIEGMHLIGNTGMGIQVGDTNAVSYLSTRVKITNCLIDGIANHDIATATDPRAETGTKVTTYGIRTYSQAADVAITGCEIRNTNAGGIYSSAANTKIRDCTFSGTPSGAVQGQAGDMTVLDCSFRDIAHAGAGLGCIYVGPCIAFIDRIEFKQSTVNAGEYIIRLNNAAARATVGDFTVTNYNTTNMLLSSGELRRISSGAGTPESVVISSPGGTWRRTDGGAATSFYVKESGTNTANGWVAK